MSENCLELLAINGITDFYRHSGLDPEFQTKNPFLNIKYDIAITTKINPKIVYLQNCMLLNFEHLSHLIKDWLYIYHLLCNSHFHNMFEQFQPNHAPMQ